MPPTLPAYRDAGEMATSAYTLGVSHPPSYPLYILVGRAAVSLFPVGDPAYRLNLLSALCAAGALAVLFELLRRRLGTAPALGAAVLLGANSTYWSVAIVPEMYSMTMLFAAILLSLALRLSAGYEERLWRSFIFLYGLFLGNRTDLLLWAPGILWLAQSAPDSPLLRRKVDAGWLLKTAGFGLLGLSVYLYLPVRSATGPWLDWNHPATLQNFVGSITRRGYGGTLDTLSKSYAIGSQFEANLRAYAAHLWKDYLGIGLVLVLIGLGAQWRRSRSEYAAATLMFGAAGPLFLFLANMPPNPHALAIVEPHYLLADLVLAVWAAEGLAVIGAGAWAAVLVLALLPATLGRGLNETGGVWRRVDRRWSLEAYDYARNVFSSVPERAALVAKKDVQLFSLWYFQTVRGQRPDVRVVAQGLAGSPWYRHSAQRRGDDLFLGPLSSAEDWTQFASLNAPAYATQDADLPPGLPLGPSIGLAVALSTAAAADESPWERVARRGAASAEEEPNFFDADLLESYAIARHRLGTYYSTAKRHEDSLRQLRLAWTTKWRMPETPVFMAYGLFSLGRMREAADAYRLGISAYAALLDKAREYHALPELERSIVRSRTEALVNLGVIVEKAGRRDEAERLYTEALRGTPDFEQAHFNLAVLYWNRDWRIVVREMSEVLRINPSNAGAARSLAEARRRLGPEK